MTNDKQKDRLVELLDEFVAKSNNTTTSALADHILADGWMRPPCKVGQTVYETILTKDGKGSIVERKVVGFHFGDFPKLRGHKRRQYLIVYHDATNSITHIDIDRIGKTVFLTKEEAEAKLKEGVQG